VSTQACALSDAVSADDVRPISVRESSDGLVSDEELLARLQADDSNVLEPLFHRYSRLTRAIAFRILHDRGEAEEVVQEAFLYLFRRAKLFDPARGAAKAWIVQIASHRALDRKLYLCRRGFYLNTDVASLGNALFIEADLDGKIGARHELSQIEQAIDELSEGQRRTLGMYYFGFFDLREIAEKLNEPLGNVRHHFYRGLARLRRNASVRKLKEKLS
jgi:RNA polymerase sigma-70 factor (ECF subfamily)